MKNWFVCVVIAFSAACDDDVTKCSSASGTCEQGDAGSQPNGDALLGPAPTVYTESSEATNGNLKTEEATGYTLESTNGIVIHGSFESSAPTADAYRFNSGALGGAGTPGFPGVDVLLVIDGDRSHHNGVSLSLDTVKDTGYSSLTGGNYFNNAALIKGQDYVIRLLPGASGKSYTLELRGHTP